MLMPMAADGTVLVEPTALPVYWHSGLPYTSSGALATGPGPVAYHDQGLPFNSLGQLVTQAQAPATP